MKFSIELDHDESRFVLDRLFSKSPSEKLKEEWRTQLDALESAFKKTLNEPDKLKETIESLLETKLDEILKKTKKELEKK